MATVASDRWPLICWLLFAAGLLFQLFSPRLKISNGAFVIPPEMAAGKNAIRLDEIVARQRRLQLLSVLLTLSGAFGLAFLYRDTLIGEPRDEVADRPRNQLAPIPREVSTQAQREKP